MTIGTITTFYSYKGGVGRSMILANTAALLAKWGYRVLCVDWDLEAPGLRLYFKTWLVPRPGLTELIQAHRIGSPAHWRAHVSKVALPDISGELDVILA